MKCGLTGSGITLTYELLRDAKGNSNNNKIVIRNRQQISILILSEFKLSMATIANTITKSN